MNLHSSQIVPVILAGDSNLGQWPLSRKNRPVQFVRSNGNHSLFQKAILCAATKLTHGEIWVCVSARCIDLVREQVHETGLDDRLKVFIEPVNRGSLTTLATLSLLLAKTNRETRIVAMEAHRPVGDEGVLVRLCEHYSQSASLEQFVVVCAERNDNRTCQLSPQIEIAPRGCSNHLCEPANESTEDSVSVCSRGVVFLGVKRFLHALSETHQKLASGCDALLASGHKFEEAFWPDIGKWSSLAAISLHDWAKNASHLYRVRVVDFHDISLTQHNNTLSGEDHHILNSTNCTINGYGPLVVVDGCDNLNITATSDAILVRGNGFSSDVSHLIRLLENKAQKQLYDAPVRQHKWGEEIELERNNGFALRRLTIRPGGQIQPHFHNHRWESWQVVSGHGRISVETETQLVEPGDFFAMPATTIHGIINTQNEPLCLLECRRGSYLSRVDHINVGTAEVPSHLPDQVIQLEQDPLHRRNTG